MKSGGAEFVLLKDSEWSVIDGDPCRVTDFAPMGSFVDAYGKIHAASATLPYAGFTIECVKLGKQATGYVTHKIDFKNLWSAFKERPLKHDEEVIVIWTKKHYKRTSKLFSGFMPKLWVMVCPKGAFELLVNIDPEPKLTGEARWKAMKPIIEWKPDVME